jgi:hypothetical protein
LDKLTPLYDNAQEMVSYCKKNQDDLESHYKRHNALLMDLFLANLDVTELVANLEELDEGANYVFDQAYTGDMRTFKEDILDKLESFDITILLYGLILKFK